MARKVGRPSSYKEEFCDALIEYMAKGLPLESFGATIGVSRAVLYDWEKVHPEFLEAKKIGEAKCLQYNLEVGRRGMMGEIPGFNSTVWVFMMKNMHKWRDKQPDEEAQTQVNVNVSTELIEKLKAEIKARK